MSIYNVFRKFKKFRHSMSIYNVLYTDSNRIDANHPDTCRSKTIANYEVYDTTQPVETRSRELLINFSRTSNGTKTKLDTKPSNSVMPLSLVTTVVTW